MDRPSTLAGAPEVGKQQAEQRTDMILGLKNEQGGGDVPIRFRRPALRIAKLSKGCLCKRGKRAGHERGTGSSQLIHAEKGSRPLGTPVGAGRYGWKGAVGGGVGAPARSAWARSPAAGIESKDAVAPLSPPNRAAATCGGAKGKKPKRDIERHLRGLHLQWPPAAFSRVVCFANSSGSSRLGMETLVPLQSVLEQCLLPNHYVPASAQEELVQICLGECAVSGLSVLAVLARR